MSKFCILSWQVVTDATFSAKPWSLIMPELTKQKLKNIIPAIMNKQENILRSGCGIWGCEDVSSRIFALWVKQCGLQCQNLHARIQSLLFYSRDQINTYICISFQRFLMTSFQRCFWKSIHEMKNNFKNNQHRCFLFQTQFLLRLVLLMSSR